MADQETSSSMYCGASGSSASVATGRPMAASCSNKSRASAKPCSTWNVSFKCGSLMSPFQPNAVRGFSK